MKQKGSAVLALAHLELREFTLTWLPLRLHRFNPHIRRPLMCPCQQYFKITSFALADDLNGTVVQVTRPSGDAEGAGLFGGSASKEHPLHRSADDYADASPFVTHHDDAARLDVVVNSFTNSGSSRVFTPSSRALRNFEPGSAPTTTKSVLRLTDDVTRPPAARIFFPPSYGVIVVNVPVSTKLRSRKRLPPSVSVAGTAILSS